MKNNTSFGKFAELWDGKVRKGIKSNGDRTQAVFEFLGKAKGKTIYEIACGSGFLARELATANAKEVWASDIAKEMIDLAQKNYETKKIKYLVREATNFKGIPKYHFDAVIIHQGIFYIKDIEALVKGVSKILKPDGVFIFTLLHPLFPDARIAMEEPTAMGERTSELQKIQEKYLKSYSKVVSKNWGDTHVSYLTYKRPLNYYFNLCGKYGLYIEAIEEPKSQTKKEGKTLKSNIPSSMIVKAVKK